MARADRPRDPRPRFEAIYDQHVLAIHRFVYARVGNRPDAEDLTGQVFMRAVEQLDVDRPAPQISAWLYRVAQNAVADYWRAFYRLPQVDVNKVAGSWEPVTPQASRHADAEAVRAETAVRGLLKQLPKQYARVLELRFLHRLSVAETAARLGISKGNAKVLQYRALRKAALMVETDG
ncbi:MAG TPA: sigma-70 family RNA polymerase sigma factor [Candidatus Limnocylindria bacterium]|jgi:RNA polymerase sigma-70 factor (ECF subfamily)|nr:sigma-70 family RNA polymerase sigma factor [Candidatus Limnocylindria bacterium]